MYYSPGVEYLCPRCNSNLIRFVFDDSCSNWSESMRLIKELKIKLLESIEITELPKWICKECNDCGIYKNYNFKNRINNSPHDDSPAEVYAGSAT